MTASTERLLTLDVVRGVAVMGILLANLPAFALPHAAYFSPLAWGGTSTADITAWFATFVLIEGKMRGLFSLLFGASMLLIVDRARASGQSAAAIHYSRMAVLFVIGVAHLYLIWWGDILAHYALVGAVAFLFTRMGTRALLAWGLGFLGLSFLSGLGGYMALLDSAARDTPQALATWIDFARSFGVPPQRRARNGDRGDARRLARQCPLALGACHRSVQLPQVRSHADFERNAARHGCVPLGPADRGVGPRADEALGRDLSRRWACRLCDTGRADHEARI